MVLVLDGGNDFYKKGIMRSFLVVPGKILLDSMFTDGRRRNEDGGRSVVKTSSSVLVPSFPII